MGEVIATQPVLFNGKCTKMGFSCFSEQILANYSNEKRTTKKIIDSKVRREKRKEKRTNKQTKQTIKMVENVNCDLKSRSLILY